MSLKRGDIVTIDIEKLQQLSEDNYLPVEALHILTGEHTVAAVNDDCKYAALEEDDGRECPWVYWFPVGACTKVSDPRTVHLDLTEKEAQILQRVLTRARRGSK